MGPSPSKPNGNLIWYQSGLYFRMPTRVCAWTHTTPGPVYPSAAKSAPRVSVPPCPSKEDEPGSRSIVEGGGRGDPVTSVREWLADGNTTTFFTDFKGKKWQQTRTTSSTRENHWKNRTMGG
ncbi:hypothetical protein CRG98_005725 [Punica granatum]|uniref:Uncharacterized protein n=1 Tax=Punica granatum TaxID=22663 RepID=A0A2I0KZF3_PUNGR|nr:hypothetical protein CRG98_005725 [Punica granatum]